MKKRQYFFPSTAYMYELHGSYFIIDKYSLNKNITYFNTTSSVALNVCSSVSMKQVLTFIALKINYI